MAGALVAYPSVTRAVVRVVLDERFLQRLLTDEIFLYRIVSNENLLIYLT